MKIQIREDFRRDGLFVNFLADEELMVLVARAFPGSILQVGYPAVCSREQEMCCNILKSLANIDIEPALSGHAIREHIDLIGALVKPYPKATANIWVPVSDYLIKRTLNRKPEEVLNHAIELINYWHKTYSPNQIDIALTDSTEKEEGLDLRVAYFAEQLHKAGARSVVICDTKGQATPEQLANIFKLIRKNNKGRIEFHPHNDNGLGIENSIVAVEHGVSAVGTALFNSGERFSMIDPRELIISKLPINSKMKHLDQFESIYRKKTGFSPTKIKKQFKDHIFITGTQYRLFDCMTPANLLFGVTSDKYILSRLLNINQEQIKTSFMESLKNSLYGQQKICFNENELISKLKYDLSEVKCL